MTGLTLDRFLPYRLSVASNSVSNRIAQSYRKRFGLKVPEWRLIAILAELGGLTRMDKITVSRAASALVERGLVGSNRNPGDGRSHFLSLTSEGQSLYTEIAPLARSLERELLADFSLEERTQLETLLRRIERAALAQDDPSGN
jgi:DNA-binding MarR family transcriptional regulator